MANTRAQILEFRQGMKALAGKLAQEQAKVPGPHRTLAEIHDIATKQRLPREEPAEWPAGGISGNASGTPTPELPSPEKDETAPR